jgi:hypothetical protein
MIWERPFHIVSWTIAIAMVNVHLRRPIVRVTQRGGEVGMNFCCDNCGWSEFVGNELFGSSLICNYTRHRTWGDECCEAWKLWEPKENEKETNMVEVVRCKDCKHGYPCKNASGEDSVKCINRYVSLDSICRKPDWFCADGERK